MKDRFRISTDLSKVPAGSNCALLIRHGDRNGALAKVVNEQEGLNEIGTKRSKQFGKMLNRFSDLVAYSSPVGRCVDTCLNISKGFGKEVEVESTKFLGMSAPFMVDPPAAYVKMRELGLVGFVDAYVNDALDRKMVLPCSEGTKMLFSYAIERIKNMSGGVGMFVTHDMILTPPLAYFFDYDYKAKGLLTFLDGIVLFEDGDGYTASHGGRQVRVLDDGTASPEYGSLSWATGRSQTVTI
jgi:hypothetical protein